MPKHPFNQQVMETYDSYVKMIDLLNENEVIFSENGKWNPLQHSVHLTKSIKITSLCFRFPKGLLKILFGTSKQTGRSYQQICELYNQKLLSGAKADLIYHPKSRIKSTNRVKITSKLLDSIKELTLISENFTEYELNSLRLPHPILGKITLKEMLFFNNYHVICHRASIDKMLQK